MSNKVEPSKQPPLKSMDRSPTAEHPLPFRPPRPAEAARVPASPRMQKKGSSAIVLKPEQVLHKGKGHY